jgi:hypothetical protein
MKKLFCAAVLMTLPLVASAQNTGELWEISTQMNIPGMPAGMGGQTQRVCQGDDPERRAAPHTHQTDRKVTATTHPPPRTPITIQCKQGTMPVDQQYTAARSDFTGSNKIHRKDGEFVMNTPGRQVGAF